MAQSILMAHHVQGDRASCEGVRKLTSVCGRQKRRRVERTASRQCRTCVFTEDRYSMMACDQFEPPYTLGVKVPYEDDVEFWRLDRGYRRMLVGIARERKPAHVSDSNGMISLDQVAGEGKAVVEDREH
jgi:hypothetical protein